MAIFNTFDPLNQDYKKHLPKTGRLLGIDLGTKRIGIAVTDEDRVISNPKLIIKRNNPDSDLKKIQNFIDEYQISAIIQGYPIQLDNSDNEMTQISKDFAKILNQYLDNALPIFLFEERLTSFEAKEIDRSGISKRKSKHIDDIAASIMLQHFLDHIDRV
ncbi:MAG: Holliday junction resolvase RuvX [Rickettsiales bacterium]|nr:Holliday junction resolvase RuvX [Rickettsiales bacterium]